MKVVTIFFFQIKTNQNKQTWVLENEKKNSYKVYEHEHILI